MYECLDERGLEFLEDVKLQEPRRMALDNYLKVLEDLNERIEDVESIMREKAEVTEEVKSLIDEHTWLALDFIMRY